MKKISVIMLMVLIVFVCGGFPNAKGGQGGGGNTVVVPDYGDLVEIWRDVDGVPILSSAGCVQPLDIYGDLIPIDDECEIPEGYDPVEVDFGRINIARAPESVLKSRFDEVITYIKASQKVTTDLAGRLQLKMETQDPDTGEVKTYWKTIDAPLECLALYAQLMKFGHLQTPDNVIASDTGDEVIYRPVLDPYVDYAKFSVEVACLLPEIAGSTAPEYLDNQDLQFASFFLAGSGDKTSSLTIDLVQYINTILGIVNENNALPDNEAFVNFRDYEYLRGDFFRHYVSVMQPTDTDGVWKETDVNLMDWLGYKNGEESLVENIAGFVSSGNDSLAVILFLHNYSVPEDLW